MRVMLAFLIIFAEAQKCQQFSGEEKKKAIFSSYRKQR